MARTSQSNNIYYGYTKTTERGSAFGGDDEACDIPLPVHCPIPLQTPVANVSKSIAHVARDTTLRRVEGNIQPMLKRDTPSSTEI